MASNSSYETSWADQWDPEPVYSYPVAHTNSNTTSSKFSDKLDKTKAVASTGVKKVKTGATAGIHWIKNKYQKTTNKN